MAFDPFQLATLLSDFSGPDEDPLSEGGNWSILNTATAEHLRLISNAVDSSGGSFAGDIWTPELFGPDCCAYATIQNVSNAQSVFCRVTTPGGFDTWEGYWLQIEGTDWGLFAVFSAIATRIGSGTGTLVAGDKYGIFARGGSLSGWHFTGGEWVQRVSAFDESHQEAGNVAFGIDRTSGFFDECYAGPVPPLSPFLPILGSGT